MSAIPLILLSAAAGAAAMGGAALRTARGLHRRIDVLHAQLDARTETASIPRARSTGPADTTDAADGTDPADGTDSGYAAGTGDAGDARAASATRTEIRTAVAEALAEERERELAEARAFWAAQEARDSGPADGSLLAGHGGEYGGAVPADPADPAEDADAGPTTDAAQAGDAEAAGAGALGGGFIPRQQARDLDDADAGATDRTDSCAEPPESPELTAARLRHPSHPGFTLGGEPTSTSAPASASAGATGVAHQNRTVGRLSELALAGTPLTDIRQGPLGTLDVYLFDDGTTLCLSPGHRETAERLCGALRDGDTPVLMGGSTVSGAFALSFGYGDGETAYLLADRVIASM